MTHDDKVPERIQDAMRGYNAPPELRASELDDMWAGIMDGLKQPPDDIRQARRPRWNTALSVAAFAAVLLIGVAIGRVSARRGPAALVADGSAAATDSVTVPEPYSTTTSRYLGQAAALLVALPDEVRKDRADDIYLARAHELLLTTRLLLDTPAADDPRLRGLLEDLELVLAQVVRLQTDPGGTELDLIRQALEQRDVLPRLRTAVANISADD